MGWRHEVPGLCSLSLLLAGLAVPVPGPQLGSVAGGFDEAFPLPHGSHEPGKAQQCRRHPGTDPLWPLKATCACLARARLNCARHGRWALRRAHGWWIHPACTLAAGEGPVGSDGSQESCPCRWSSGASGHKTRQTPSAPVPSREGWPRGQGLLPAGGRRVWGHCGVPLNKPQRHWGPRGRGGASGAASELFSTPRHAAEGASQSSCGWELSCQLHSSRCHSYLQDFSLTRSITIQKSPWRKVSACWFVSLAFASSAGEGRKKAISNQLVCLPPPLLYFPLLLPSFRQGGVKSPSGRSFSRSMHGWQQIGRGEQPREDVRAGRAVPWEWSLLCVQVRQWMCSLPLWVHLFFGCCVIPCVKCFFG